MTLHRSFLIAGVALAGLTGPALAADLGPAAPPATYVAPVMPAAYDWSGIYVGINVGGAFGRGNLSGGGGSVSGDYNGFVGGGQLGANYQFGNVVLGVEGDFQGSTISRTQALGGGVSAKSNLDWLATVRGRLGYAFDRVLPYVTGGVAFAHNELSASGGGATLSDDKIHTGYTVGGGVEYGITHNLSAKVEYLYTDIGSKTYFGAINAKAHFHMVRAGLNYRFW